MVGRDPHQTCPCLFSLISAHMVSWLLLKAPFIVAVATAAESAGDVKYIRCETCDGLVSAVHAELTKGHGSKKKTVTSEADVMKVIEQVCAPDTDVGAWLRSVDLVEDSDRLRLVGQAEDGPCGSECATVRRACEALLEEGWENELGEALYSSLRSGDADVDELRSLACKQWSTACKKAPPKLEKGRPPGPPFRPFTQEERAQRDARSGAPPPPGLLSADAISSRFGVLVAATSSYGHGHGAVYGGDMLAREHFSAESETTGQGTSAESLEHLEAFLDVSGCLPPWCALFFGALDASGASAPSAPPRIAVSANAQWSDDPAVEAASLLYASHGASTMLRFWSHWATQREDQSLTSMHRVIAVLDQLGLPTLAHAAMRAALASRIEAPLVEAWAQLAGSLDADPLVAAWVMACGVLYDSIAAALRETITMPSCANDSLSRSPSLRPLEHVIRIADEHATEGSRLVVYVDPHSASFGNVLASIDEALAGTPTFALLLRYRPAPARGRVPLFGFGIDVALRSTEYSVADDKAIEEDDGDADVEGDDVIGGDAAPSWLLRRKATEPVTTEGLVTDRLSTLGVRAAIAVLRARRPLAALRDVSGSLPSLSRYLTRLDLSSPTSNAISHALGTRWPLLASARGALTINGLPLNLAREDAAHAAVRSVLMEATAASELCDLGLMPATASRLLALPPPRPIRLDVSGVSALWLNDITSDAAFEKWPTELSAMSKALRGSTQFTRHNALSAIFVIDPQTYDGAALGGYAAQLCRKNAPIRVGVVIRTANSAKPSLGVSVAAYAWAKGGREGLLAALQSLEGSASKAAKAAVNGAPAPERALGVDALRGALKAVVTAGTRTGSKAAKRKAKAGQDAPALALDVDADAAAILERLGAENAGHTYEGDANELYSLQALAAWTATSASVVGLALPTEESFLLFNGLILKGEAREIRDALVRESRLEASALRHAIQAGELVVPEAVPPPRSPPPPPLPPAAAPPDEMQRAVINLWAAHGVVSRKFMESAANVHAERQIRRAIDEEASTSSAVLDLNISQIRQVLDMRVWSTAGGWQTRVAINPKLANCTHGCIELSGEGSGAAVHVVAVVEPLSLRANFIASLLIALRSALGVRCTLLLATPSTNGDGSSVSPSVPLSEFHSTAIGTLDPLRPPVASLDIVRSSHTLTLSLRTPQAWMIHLAAATDDLDNIQLSTQPPGHVVSAAFNLSSLLVAGSCSSMGDARKSKKGKSKMSKKTATSTDAKGCTGHQLHLRRWTAIGQQERACDLSVSDTMVMGGNGNGYFQLQAPGPGVFQISAAADGVVLTDDGISQAAQDDAKVEGAERGAAPAGKMVPLISWAGGSTPVRVSAPLPTAARGGRAAPTERSEERVHVFSLASGLLYERFLRIMMRTASERCSRPVSFWILGTFLSPSMREAVRSGALARAISAGLGMERAVEINLVEYRWPSHLRHQREKQRLIWGYKILYLDVLLPQHLSRIIYVDSDQIVQGDLAELWDRPLQGAPIAMTPFCNQNANPDTEGFRFWKTGFWSTHLGTHPYHISALFVVDLQMFRAHGLGDQYRSTYQSLTADPNSLANLDQDLPNYLQHGIPIHSLPEEWLWCETWCGNGSKASAKTIDLCNNPQTKEPKLEQAKRIGGERWVRIDEDLEKALSSEAQAEQEKDEL